MNHLRWLVIPIFLAFASCNHEKPPLSDAEYIAQWRQSQSKDGATATGGEWHFDFHSVRAYRINWDDEFTFDGIIAEAGLNTTRIPEGGVRLSDAHVIRLQTAVTGTHPDRGIGLCIYPHHAFVFYDESHEIVGSIDVCFLCQNWQGSPRGYAENWDLLAIAELIHDIGMPLRNPDWE